ncbi:MAG: hypothetical protein RIG84_05050 [Roseovarius sp.]
MRQVIAIANVIAWSGFWAFGYLALSAGGDAPGQMTIAAVLAALGGGVGMLAFFWLVRHSEQTGYARKPNRAYQREEETGEV